MPGIEIQHEQQFLEMISHNLQKYPQNDHAKEKDTCASSCGFLLWIFLLVILSHKWVDRRGKIGSDICAESHNDLVH